jgi:peptidoglycan/xylan/chitin deacetylase (PgdA/CDA1 family)
MGRKPFVVGWLGLSLAIAILLAVACGGEKNTPTPAASPTARPSSPTVALPSPTPTSTPSASPVSPTPSGTTATPTPTPQTATTYEVRAGDTLFSIARRFATTVEAIVTANNLADPSQIEVGQVLLIPGGTSPTSTPASGSAQVVRKADTSSQTVFLTFDAGSDAGFTGQILDTLKANGIVAAFGVTGRWAEQNPDLLRRIAQEGHTVINHSYDHPSFTGRSTSLSPLTQAQRWEQLDKTESIIQNLAGVSTKPYFRPPYGDYDDSVNEDIYARGYLYNVMWTVDSLGWNGLAADAIVERCLALAEPGAIYVFHVGSASQDAAALQRVIDGLRAMGYATGSGLQGIGATT